MELMSDHKLSDVGVIPNEWAVVSVKQLVEKGILAKPLDGNHGNIHPKSSDYVEYGIPFVMANNFANGEVDLDGCKFITKDQANSLQKGFSFTGDVLLTHKGTIGNTAIVGRLSSDYIMLTPQVTYYRAINANLLDSRFLRHYFDGSRFQALFRSLAGGGTRAYLGIEKQLDLPIVTPPIDEQRAIASCLSDVDALIAGLEKLIAKKRDLKQAAMQQLLTGQTRLPGFSGEWELTKLGDVLHFQVGFPFGSIFFNEKDQGLRLIKNRDLKADDQVFFYSGSYEENYVVTNDDLLVGMDGDFLPCRWTKGKALLNQRVGRLLPTNKLDIRFAYYFMLEPLKEIEAVTASTTVKHLSHGDIENIVKPLPLLDEQIAIGTILYEIDAELGVLECRLLKTHELKQGMMQELLTGRTRLV